MCDLSLSDDNASTETETSMSLDGIRFAVRGRRGDYVAYPIGVEGVVVGQGATFQEALESAKSATHFHIETFGVEVFPAADIEPGIPSIR